MNTARVQKQDNTKLAVAAVLFAVLALSFGDAVIKLFSVEFPLWQIYVLRSAIVTPVLVIAIKFRDRNTGLIPLSVSWTVIRSLLLAAMWIAYYVALPHIQLTVAAAVYYTIPLFITLLSAMFTGDKVSGRAWIAVLIGFAGVLVIVRPDTSGINGYVLLPLLAAILYALAMILTRTKCVNENPMVLSLFLNLTFITVGLLATLIIALWSPEASVRQAYPFLLGEWAVLDTRQWLAMAVLALVILIGSVFAAYAYQNGKPSTIATFDYFYLAFSAIWGLLIFSEIPDPLTILGMMLIAIGGLLAVKR